MTSLWRSCLEVYYLLCSCCCRKAVQSFRYERITGIGSFACKILCYKKKHVLHNDLRVSFQKYRIELVLDRIMQRRCESLIRAVLQNQDRAEFSLDEELNKQCLKAMVEFLNSKSPKSNKLPKMPQFSSEPHIPMCHWCKGPLEFPLEMFSFDEALKDVDKELMTGLAQEQWSGFKWNVRRHPVKEFGVHKPEICILTLLPLQFPYRRCSNCYVSALFEPGKQFYTFISTLFV